MGEVSKGEGRTILFVSHDMNAIMNLCRQTILLENGLLKIKDLTTTVLSVYRNVAFQNQLIWQNKVEKKLAHFSFIEICLLGVQPLHKLKVNFQITAFEIHNSLFVAFDICNSIGAPILQAIPESKPFIIYAIGTQKFSCEICLEGLIPDTYFISAWIGEHNTQTTDWQKEILSFEILMSPIPDRTMPHSYANGFIVPASKMLNR